MSARIIPLVPGYLSDNGLGSTAVDRWSKMVHIPFEIGCWIWCGYRDYWGYGQMYRGSPFGGSIRSHIVSYIMFTGPIGGLNVLHSCDNPSCVYPGHLWLGTRADNIYDRNIKGRDNHFRKLSESQVIKIRSDYSGEFGEMVSMAKDFGVSRSNIEAIIRRRSWKNI
jgi:hypothetical protein